jgi:hypothetical protein
MTVLSPHGLKYIADPGNINLPPDDHRLKAVEVDCPSKECWRCKQEVTLESLRAAGFPQH